jgi:hypothetical protein
MEELMHKTQQMQNSSGFSDLESGSKSSSGASSQSSQQMVISKFNSYSDEIQLEIDEVML